MVNGEISYRYWLKNTENGVFRPLSGKESLILLQTYVYTCWVTLKIDSLLGHVGPTDWGLRY